jgi:hypothetical protein
MTRNQRNSEFSGQGVLLINGYLPGFWFRYSTQPNGRFSSWVIVWHVAHGRVDHWCGSCWISLNAASTSILAAVNNSLEDNGGLAGSRVVGSVFMLWGCRAMPQLGVMRLGYWFPVLFEPHGVAPAPWPVWSFPLCRFPTFMEVPSVEGHYPSAHRGRRRTRRSSRRRTRVFVSFFWHIFISGHLRHSAICSAASPDRGGSFARSLRTSLGAIVWRGISALSCRRRCIGIVATAEPIGCSVSCCSSFSRRP